MSYRLVLEYKDLFDPNDNLLPIYSLIKSYGCIYSYKGFLCSDIFFKFEMKRLGD